MILKGMVVKKNLAAACTATLLVLTPSAQTGKAQASVDAAPHITNSTLIFHGANSVNIDLTNVATGSTKWQVRSHSGSLKHAGHVEASHGGASVHLPKLRHGFYTFTASNQSGSTTAAFIKIGGTPQRSQSKYGIGVHSSYASRGSLWDPRKLFPIAKQLGFNSIRDDLHWSKFPDEGLGDTPATLKTALSLADANGLAPLMIADYGLRKYAPPGAQEPRGSNFAPPYEKVGYDAYGAFIRNFLSRNPSVPMIEIWNEFNGGLNTCNSDPTHSCRSGAAYAKLVKAVHDRTHSDHPNVEIIAGGQSGYGPEWWQQFADAGGARYADAYSYHPYGATPRQLKAYWQDLMGRLPQKPVYISEVGWSVTDTGTRPGNTAQVKNERQQADRLVANYLVPTSAGGAMPGNYQYNLVSENSDPASVEGNFGILRAPTARVYAYQPRQAAFAFYYMRSTLGEVVAPTRTQLKDGSGVLKPADIMWSGDKNRAAIYRTDLGKVNDPAPREVSFSVPNDRKTSLTNAMGDSVMQAAYRSKITVTLGASPLYVRVH